MIDFKQLTFWLKSHNLVKQVYSITENFPTNEKYGLQSQIRRSALSVPSNISEGCGRNSKQQLKHFLQISTGSLSELQYQIFLSFELGLISSNDYQNIDTEIIEVRKMIFAYSSKL